MTPPICNGISNAHKAQHEESCNFSHVNKGDVVSYYILNIVNFVEPFPMENNFFLYTVFTHECFNLLEKSVQIVIQVINYILFQECLITMESNIECTLI